MYALFRLSLGSLSLGYECAFQVKFRQLKFRWLSHHLFPKELRTLSFWLNQGWNALHTLLYRKEIPLFCHHDHLPLQKEANSPLRSLRERKTWSVLYQHPESQQGNKFHSNRHINLPLIKLKKTCVYRRLWKADIRTAWTVGTQISHERLPYPMEHNRGHEYSSIKMSSDILDDLGCTEILNMDDKPVLQFYVPQLVT